MCIKVLVSARSSSGWSRGCGAHGFRELGQNFRTHGTANSARAVNLERKRLPTLCGPSTLRGCNCQPPAGAARAGFATVNCLRASPAEGWQLFPGKICGPQRVDDRFQAKIAAGARFAADSGRKLAARPAKIFRAGGCQPCSGLHSLEETNVNRRPAIRDERIQLSTLCSCGRSGLTTVQPSAIVPGAGLATISSQELWPEQG